MTFNEALKALYSGKKVALPEWGGYWFVEKGLIKTEDGEDVEKVRLGSYCNRTDWQIVGETARTVTPSIVKANMKDVQCTTIDLTGKPTTVVQVKMKNGFVITESTTCVDPAIYDENIGKQVCLERIENKVWELLGFELSSRMNGSALD